jgi:hypothetical protein
MIGKSLSWRAAAVAILSVAATAADAHGRNGDPEVVIEWNQILEGVLPAGGLTPPRNYAMVHIAMFDAINSITRTHRPYRTSVWAPWGASAEVAAAQAARDVIVAQFPTAQATADAALQARVASVGERQARSAIQVGKAVAAAILAWRQNDGWTVAPAAYVLPAFPGLYQPTPPAFPAPGFRQFEHTKPFALLTSTQYLPAGPPTVTSERYAADFEEVKSIGSATSSIRTAEQTQTAQLFASVTSRTVHWALWNHVARDTARSNGLSLIQTARLYALLNVSIHDGLQQSQTAKFIYGMWRPVTAIRRADEDMNALTIADPSWTPLLTSPTYPSHPGNMACVGASAARALALAHGTDDVSFTAVWQGNTGNPDVSRPYTRFSQLAEDQANSRIYGGIHFRYESIASQQACPKVAEYVNARFMRPTLWSH